MEDENLTRLPFLQEGRQQIDFATTTRIGKMNPSSIDLSKNGKVFKIIVDGKVHNDWPIEVSDEEFRIGFTYKRFHTVHSSQAP